MAIGLLRGFILRSALRANSYQIIGFGWVSLTEINGESEAGAYGHIIGGGEAHAEVSAATPHRAGCHLTTRARLTRVATRWPLR
jgi:hypothetical protein